MEKHNKIYWKKGLDITPDTFINADNYHIAERNLLGRFCAFRLYGILSDEKFYISKRLDNNTLYIENLECSAITRDGYLIDVQRNTPFDKEISLKEATDTEYYVIITVDPYSNTFADDEKVHIYPEYKLALKRVGVSIENGIPVLKIYKDDYQAWKIDENYIPPSIALYSVDSLKEKYIEILNKYNNIIEKLPESDAIYRQATLFKLELDNYCLQESPEELTLLLKKICWILKLYVKLEKNITEFPSVEKFMEMKYNHNEIGNILNLGLESLEEIDQKIDEKPKEIKPEEPEELEVIKV